MYAIIEDGCTDERTIPAAEGYWPEIKLTLRPFTTEEATAIGKIVGPLSIEAAKRVWAERLAGDGKTPGKLLSWSVLKKDGTAAPISVDNLLKLRPPLWEAIFGFAYSTPGNDLKN